MAARNPGLERHVRPATRYRAAGASGSTAHPSGSGYPKHKKSWMKTLQIDCISSGAAARTARSAFGAGAPRGFSAAALAACDDGGAIGSALRELLEAPAEAVAMRDSPWATAGVDASSVTPKSKAAGSGDACGTR